MNVFATHLPVVRPSAFRLSQQQQNKQNSKPWQQEVALDNVISAARKRNAAAAGDKSNLWYQYNWNHFKRFADQKRQEGIIPPGDKYLARRNVDFSSQTLLLR